MIIVSGSSAEATQLVRTGRYLSARCCSSVACNDTPRYGDVRLISVHTGVLTGASGLPDPGLFLRHLIDINGSGRPRQVHDRLVKWQWYPNRGFD